MRHVDAAGTLTIICTANMGAPVCARGSCGRDFGDVDPARAKKPDSPETMPL